MKRICFVLFVILSLLFCACAAREESVENIPEAEIINVTPIPDAAGNAESPVQTPGFSINPVSAFYALYNLEAKPAHLAYRLELYDRNDTADIQTLLDFDEHRAFILRPNASIGRLCASGGVYSDTLMGAASGSGTLTPQSSADVELANSYSESITDDDETRSENLRASNDDFIFSFTYNDGFRMRGYLRADLLYYAMYPTYSNEIVTHDIDEESGNETEIVTSETLTGDFLYGAYLQRAPGGQWKSLVLRSDQVSLAVLQNQRVSFYTRTPESELFLRLQTLSFDELCAYVQTGSVGSDGNMT